MLMSKLGKNCLKNLKASLISLYDAFHVEHILCATAKYLSARFEQDIKSHWLFPQKSSITVTFKWNLIFLPEKCFIKVSLQITRASFPLQFLAKYFT